MDEAQLQELFVVSLQFENAFGILGAVAVRPALNGSDSIAVCAGAPALPSVVCGAFALELQLKCLIACETGHNLPRGHSLVRLFESTKPTTQTAIKAEYERLIQENETWVEQWAKNGLSLDFDDVLRSSSEAFQEWRYHHEYDKGKSWLAAPIMKAVRDEILAIHSNWKSLF